MDPLSVCFRRRGRAVIVNRSAAAPLPAPRAHFASSLLLF